MNLNLSPDQCYQAVLTRDARFDGRFFVAVKTTRIYCRPICRVKTPQRQNCQFFNCAAAAEGADYRPCKRCRPELAPGSSPMEASSQLAQNAAFHICGDFLADHSLSDLADRLGVTDRQMRRVFREEFGVSPVEFWQTHRLLLAKQLLTDSAMPVTSVALASGFQSVRRFNALMKERYRMTPTELRRRQPKQAFSLREKERRALLGKNVASLTPSNARRSYRPVHGTNARPSLEVAASSFSFRLSYRPPLDWKRLLGFLAQRAIPHVEEVRDGAYFRTVQVKRQDREFAGHIQVGHLSVEHMLFVRLSDGLLPVCAFVLERVKRLFDLQADPAAIKTALGPIAQKYDGLRVPGGFAGFEIAVRAILGQQISVAAARTLAGRLALRFGTPLLVPELSLKRTFPLPQRIARAVVGDMTALGITKQRAGTLIALAQAVAGGRLLLEPGRRVEETLEQLHNLPGIGEWTAQYIAMRALAWPDGFPHTDLGIKKALGETNPGRILKIAEPWRPWRAYAAMHLWAGLEDKNYDNNLFDSENFVAGRPVDGRRWNTTDRHLLPELQTCTGGAK